MSLEKQLTRIIRSKDYEKLLLEFNEYFVVGFEKTAQKITQEPLDWCRGLMPQSEFSNDMADFVHSRPSKSELLWQELELKMIRVYTEILNPLDIQEYENRDIRTILQPLSNLLSFYKFPFDFVKKRAKDLQHAAYSFVFAPDCAHKISNYSLLKTKSSKDCVALHTNGKVSKYLEDFTHLQLVFSDGLYVIVHHPNSKNEYFFADRTTDDCYNNAFFYLQVKPELRKELEYCVNKKHELITSWHKFKSEVDKTDFSDLLKGIGFIYTH